MRKILIIFFLIIMLAGCGTDDLSKLIDYETPEFADQKDWDNPETDSGIKIDGVMDEEIWEQVRGNEVVFSSKVSEDIQMSTVTYLGEKGVYFGIVVKDPAVYYSPDRRASRNSGAEIYVNEFGKYINDYHTFSFRLVPTGEDGDIYTEVYIYDRNGEASIWIARHLAASTVQGIINTSNCEGYTIELFIPYETLNITEKCEYIQYFPAFNHVESVSSEGERTWSGYPNCKTQFPYSWLVVSNEKIEDRKSLPKIIRARDEYMNIDGFLNEEEWVETHKYRVTENNVTTETQIYSHLGQKGLYLGFKVDEKNARIISEEENTNHGSGVVFYISNGSFSIRTSWQIRIFVDGYYRVGRYSGIVEQKWYTPDASTFLNLEVKTTVTDDYYVLEAFIPYQEIGISNVPASLYLLAGTFARKSDGDYAERFGNLGNLTNEQRLDLNNYIILSNEGQIPQNLYLEDIILTESNRDGDHYHKFFGVYSDQQMLNAVRGVNFSPEIAPYITETEDGMYELKVPAEMLLEEGALYFSANYRGISTEFKIEKALSAIEIDGVLDEGLWNQNGYVYKAVEGSNVVTVETISHLTKDGIYLGFTVTDANTAIISNSPNVNHGSGIILYITDGPLNKTTSHMMRIFADGYYRCAEYEGTRWYGPKNDYYLDIEVATSLTADGYVIEVFLPFASLKMAENTEEVYIFSGAFVKRTDGKYAERYGLTNVFNDRNNNFDYYFKFDETGYVVERLFVDDMVLTEADLVDGNYVKTFVVTSDVDRMVRVEAEFDSEYITKNVDGTYTLTVPASMVPSEIEVSVNGITTSFTIMEK